MYDKLIIIGASGHGKVAVDIALKLNRYKEIVFLDNDQNKKECMGFQIIGKSSDAKEYIGTADFFVAIGNAEIRKKVTDELAEKGASITTLIHPAACVGNCVEIGEGTVVMAGAIINSGSVINKGCIINTASSVDHDCCLGEYVHVSVGAHLCGIVNVGSNTWIGAGSVVKNCVNISSDCMIGVGAVVVKDIEEAGTYIGVPARKTEEKRL